MGERSKEQKTVPTVMCEDFEKLQLIVWQDLNLQRELQKITRRDLFVSRVVEIARERGLQIEPEDVLEAIRRHRRGWVEKWN